MALPARALALGLLAASCAPALRATRVPEASAGMARWRIEDLTFEVPAAFRLKEAGAGLTLRFCGEPELSSCGALGLLLRLDLPPGTCDDRERFRAWLASPAGEAHAATDLDTQDIDSRFPVADADLQRLEVAGRPAWLFSDARGQWRNLVLCDGARTWVVKELTWGPQGLLAASTAFNAFARTARLGPPAGR